VPKARKRDGADIGLIQVRAHTGHIADVIADVIRNDGRVPGSSFGNTGFDLADKVGAHVGSLRENAAAHTGEQSIKEAPMPNMTMVPRSERRQNAEYTSKCGTIRKLSRMPKPTTGEAHDGNRKKTQREARG
jgi:hypothetical protein